MKADKYTLNITVEALSEDCFYSLVRKAMEMISEEYNTGKIRADDGDCVEWNITSKHVEF